MNDSQTTQTQIIRQFWQAYLAESFLPEVLNSFAFEIDVFNSSIISFFPTTTESKPHANLRRFR